MNNLKHIKVMIENNLISIALNRPKLHNAFNEEVIEELIICFEMIEEVAAKKQLRVVTIEGTGKSFCAGADLNWMKKMKNYSEDENKKDSLKLAKLFHTINNCSLPVIGFVHGAAIGGGSGLVSVCDYVLVKKSTRFAFSEVRLGLLPAVISPFVIAKISETYSRAYFLSGAIFNEDTALKMGLVHEVVNESEWEKAKERVVKSFLKAAPNAAIVAKLLIKDVLAIGLKNKSENKSANKDMNNELLEYTSAKIAKIRIGEEAQEGMEALLEKRSPSWSQNEK